MIHSRTSELSPEWQYVQSSTRVDARHHNKHKRIESISEGHRVGPSRHERVNTRAPKKKKSSLRLTLSIQSAQRLFPGFFWHSRSAFCSFFSRRSACRLAAVTILPLESEEMICLAVSLLVFPRFERVSPAWSDCFSTSRRHQILPERPANYCDRMPAITPSRFKATDPLSQPRLRPKMFHNK